jgi:hypothetical protein
VRLAGFEGGAQRLARPKQVLLAYDVIQRARPQFLGERCRRLNLAEEASPLQFNPLTRRRPWVA